jgi:von Willebrand factor type A domain
MSEINMRKSKIRKLVVTSLAVSIGLHGIGIYFLATQPMMLQHSLRSLFGISIAAPEYLDSPEEQEIAKKNKVMEDVFEHILVFSSHFQQPFDLVELPRGVNLAPETEFEELSHILSSQTPSFLVLQEDAAAVAAIPLDIELPAMPEHLLAFAENTQLKFTPRITITPSVGSYEIEQIALPQEEQIYIIDPSEVKPSYYFAEEEPQHINSLNDTFITRSFPHQGWLEADRKIIEFDTSLGTHKLTEEVPFIAHPPLAKMHVPRLTVSKEQRDFDEYLPSSIAATSEWNEDFDLDITFLPHPEGNGYIFSLALKPNFDISQYSLKHDVFFIIDRSVKKHRYEVYKRAVTKALSCLQPGDTFNIFLVDKKLTRLHAKSLPVTPKTIRAAEYFLEKQADNPIVSMGDIYASLEKILPEVEENGSVHSAILISDGVSQVSSRKQSQILRSWIEKNNGKLTVYTAAVGQKNDLLMLDLLSSISGGKLLWSDTHSSFPRKLAKLVLDLRDPVATDITIDALPFESGTKITLAPAFFQSPVLFSHQPYVIYGSIDRPGPFDLMVQGRHRDQWIAIKKSISFVDGTKGDRSLLNHWSAQKTQRIYTKFLDDGKTAYLKEAKEILKRSRSEVAFE